MARKKDTDNPRLSWERVSESAPAAHDLIPLEKYSFENQAADNLLVIGDNLTAAFSLENKYKSAIDLIYIDPPYATGRVLKGPSGNSSKKNSHASSGTFDDRWENMSDYLNMLAPRLEIMHKLLSDKGSIYVHVDWHAVHYVKILMDEIFGISNFQNEIAWCYREAVNSKKRWNRKHDIILFYTKGDEFTFNYREVLEPHADATLKKYRHNDERGPYRLMGRGLKESPIRSARDVSPDWEKKHPELTYRHYITDGRLPVDYWSIDIVNQMAAERTGYPTQKPRKLLDRIIRASSNPGDLVADFFCGSGVTAESADILGRKWITCDANPAAIQVARKRLLLFGAKTGFTVTGLKGQGAHEKKSMDFGIKKRRGSSIEISLNGTASEDGSEIDFWAVDTSYQKRPFSPAWWSCANRKHLLEVKTPSLPLPKKNSKIAVLASDTTGNQFFSTLKI